MSNAARLATPGTGDNGKTPVYDETNDEWDLAHRGVIESNTQTGTSYTLVLTDAGKAVTMSNASASTLTVPPNSSVAFPVGTVVAVEQLGAGTVTLTPGSGVTINSRGAALDLAGQYAAASIRKTATDTWLATGDLV